MTIQEFIHFINQDSIIETLINNKIYRITLKQKDTYRPIGMIVTNIDTRESGNTYYSEYQLEIPYKGINPENAQIKELHILPNNKSTLEIQDNSIPNDKHIPVYYKQTVYDNQDVIYLISKNHYDDIVMRTEYLDILDQRDPPSPEDITPYYTDSAPVVYEYYHEIDQAVRSWQKIKIKNWYDNNKQCFTGGMTALSLPIDQIITLMYGQGFDLIPAPDIFERGELHKVLVIHKDNKQEMFLIAVTCYVERWKNPTIEEIQAHILEFIQEYQEIKQHALNKDPSENANYYLAEHYEYEIDARIMDPNIENCSNPEIIIRL